MLLYVMVIACMSSGCDVIACVVYNVLFSQICQSSSLSSHCNSELNNRFHFNTTSV